MSTHLKQDWADLAEYADDDLRLQLQGCISAHRRRDGLRE